MFDRLFDWWNGLPNKSIKVGIAVFVLTAYSSYAVWDVVTKLNASVDNYEQIQDSKLNELDTKLNKRINEAATELAVLHVKLLFADAITEEQVVAVTYKMSGKNADGSDNHKDRPHSGEGDIKLVCQYGLMDDLVLDKKLGQKICLINRSI